MKEYRIIDYTDKYHSIMVFDKNKDVLIHRWYPFVEGYSKEFIENILSELNFIPRCALEPFCGSGTTPVELQNHGIKCFSFEVSPFMYLLTKVKLEQSYDQKVLFYYRNKIASALKKTPINIRTVENVPFGNTVVYREGINKWNFNNNALDGLLDLRYVIRHEIDDIKYKNLFSIGLASIILKNSNMFRNGKCLSYKKGWQTNSYDREDIHHQFLDKIDTVIAEDIKVLSSRNQSVNNSEFCYYGDVRRAIELIPDNSLDLIITSPPYLNSRDYTDIYMLELKVLELVNNYAELRELRKKTLRSHVQIKYLDVNQIDNKRLNICLNEMKNSKDKSWNRDIFNMICGYFEDMSVIFEAFSRKMHSGGVIYFNVANSAYFGVEVPVDLIIADIAEKYDFKVREIRKARNIKTSPQQAKLIGKLRESILVIDKC